MFDYTEIAEVVEQRAGAQRVTQQRQSKWRRVMATHGRILAKLRELDLAKRTELFRRLKEKAFNKKADKADGSVAFDLEKAIRKAVSATD